MTQDNLIARIEDAELALAHWDEGRNSEYWLRHPVPIERLSPPLDGEGVIQADRDAAAAIVEWQNGLEPRFFHPDMPAGIREGVWDNHNVVQAFAAHRRAALATLTPREQRMEEAWQPIETAPKDGSYIMLFPDTAVNGWGWTVGSWREGVGVYDPYNGSRRIDAWMRHGGGCLVQITHWRPLPEPPALASADAVLGEEG